MLTMYLIKMSKRAVSPLIAAILLIALTVSIGAMIIGWGKQYVQQQTSCLGTSVNIIKAQLDTHNNQITVGFINTGNQKLDAEKVYAILYTASGKIFKCPYISSGSLPSKLPCALTNPVDENGNSVSIVDLGKYTEYSLKYSDTSNAIPDSELQLNAFIQIGYSSCNEISEKYPIS